jgi:phage shock protein PspC (stress-responsive transcriptional regulator)
MKKLYRSRTNKKIAGICGGLGDYFAVDPVIIRLLFLAICFFTAILPMVIAYLVAVIIIPQEPSKRPVKRYKHLYRSRKNKFIAGILAGLAKYFNMDPTIIRIIFIILMVITGFAPMILTYVFAWIIIPEAPSNKEIDIE